MPIPVCRRIKDVSSPSITSHLSTNQLCEERIIAALRREYPTHHFVGEESTFAGEQDETNAEFCWFIDPVDGACLVCISSLYFDLFVHTSIHPQKRHAGTTNFCHGYPFVAVSIGLALHGDPVVGVVFLPMLGQMYIAWHQGGATCNGQPIRVASAAHVGEALCMNNIGSNRSYLFTDRTLYRLKWLLHGCKLQGLRNSGSAAVNLAHVASGKLDVFFEDGVGGPWDWCAGQVLVEEAGGVVVGLNGERVELATGRKGRVVAGNATVVADVVSRLRSADRRYMVKRVYDVAALASTVYVAALVLSAVLAGGRRK